MDSWLVNSGDIITQCVQGVLKKGHALIIYDSVYNYDYRGDCSDCTCYNRRICLHIC